MSACDIKQKCIETNDILREQLKEDPDFDAVVNPVEIEVLSNSEEVQEPAGHEEILHSVVRMKRIRRTAKVVKSKKQREFRKPSKSDFCCFLCDATFDMIKSKNEHINNVHSTVDRCRICDRVCKTPLATERHTKTHIIKDNIFLCPVCAATFYKKYSLDRHIAQLHGESAPLYFCDQCNDWKTKFRTNLKRHMRTVHLNIKQHRCPYDSCPDKFFTTKDTLNFHLVGHHNLVLIKCSNCSQKFDTESDLQEHKSSGRCVQRIVRKRSRGVKPVAEDVGFSCQICQRTFLNKTQFSVHYHQKHKTSLNCKVCNKEFTQYANLLRHVKVRMKIYFFFDN